MHRWNLHVRSMERILAKIPQTWMIPNKNSSRGRSMSDNALYLDDDEDDDVVSRFFSSMLNIL